MRAEMIPTINELRRLAIQQNWPAVTADLDAIAGGSEECTAMVIAAAESNPREFQNWATAHGSCQQMDLATLQTIDVRARITPHLIAFFAADHLIEAAEVEAVARSFFSRPAGSYAVVIDVSNLSSEEDVRVVERSAWRLLVNDPPSNWTQGELVAHGVYFWNEGAAADFLHGRVQADGQKLAEWLRSPGAAREKLEAHEALDLVGIGEDLFRQRRGRRLSGNAAKVHELSAAMDEMMDFRDRLNRRLDGDAELLVQEVASAMRSWSILLKEQIHATWNDVFRGKRTITTEMARSIVESKLREVSPVWAAGIEDLIQAQRAELKRDSEDFYQSVNWQLVNQVARDSGGADNYPDTLLVRAIASNDHLESRVTGGTALGEPQTTDKGFLRNLVLFGLPVSVGVGAAASWIMRFPMGIPIGLLAGYLSTAAASQGRPAECDMEECGRFTVDAVKHFQNRAIVHFQSEIRTVATRFRQRMGEEIRRLQDLLEKAMHSSYGSAESGDDRQVAESLAEIRSKLQAILNA